MLMFCPLAGSIVSDGRAKDSQVIVNVDLKHRCDKLRIQRLGNTPVQGRVGTRLRKSSLLSNN